MSELLASIQDINAHLPINVQINDSVDDSLQVDAYRLIAGQLVSVFSNTVIVTWTSPDTTPDQIRGIAGRLIASKYYARLLAGETPDEIPPYSVSLYNQAVGLLADIRSGNLIVIGTDGNPISDTDTDISEDMYPTDTSTPGPQFTMDRVLS